MYPQHSLNTRWCGLYPVISRHLLLLLSAALLSTASTALRAGDATPFHQQLRQANPNIASPSYRPMSETGAEPDFHYLWMQQYQPEYRHREGKAAAAHLLRLMAKSWYKANRKSSRLHIDADGFSSNHNDLDYRLRLSAEKIRLGIEYQF